jgi:Plavaka transposase
MDSTKLNQVGGVPGGRGSVDTPGFKHAVYHCSMRKILSPLQYIAEHGMVVRCWDGIYRRFFPFIQDLISDYKEQYDLSYEVLS